MPVGYSRSPKLLKGALVEFSERFIGPVPNVIIFQYNPEKLTRKLTTWQSAEPETIGHKTKEAATAQPFDPPESFDLELELDATDALEEPESHPVAVISGVADRVAALEMLLYPSEGGGDLLGSLMGSLNVSASIGSSGFSFGGSTGGQVEIVSRGTAPIVLFVWGPGRIVPVRLTSFAVDEQAFSPLLYPIQAKVTVGLKILTPDDLKNHPNTFAREIAIAAFKLTRTQKQVWAAANIANTVESVLGMLPF